MTQRPTKTGALPSIPSGLAPDLRRFFEGVSESLQTMQGQRGDKLDRVIRLRDIQKGSPIGSFLVNALADQVAGSLGPSQDPLSPPTSFQSISAFGSVMLVWDYNRSPNYSRTEVFRASVELDANGDLTGPIPEFSQNFLFGSISGDRFNDNIGEGYRYYYWVRHVNKAEIPGAFAGPVSAKSAPIPSVILDRIQTEINSDAFITKLSSAISLGEVQPALDALEADILGQINSGDNALSSAITAANTARANGDAALQSSLNQFGVSLNNQGGQIATLNNVTGTQATAIQAISTTVGTQGTSIASLQDTTATHATAITRLGAFDATAGKYTFIKNIEQVNADQASRLGTLESSSTSYNNSINSLNSVTSTHALAITRLGAYDTGAGKYSFISTLEQVDASQATRIGNLETSSGQLSTAIINLQTTTGTQASQLTRLSAANLPLPESLISEKTWVVGTAGAQIGYSAPNGTNNSIVRGVGPYSTPTAIWRGKSTGQNGGDGGFHSDYVTVTPSKTYRFSVWVRAAATNTAGTSYLGLAANNGILELNNAPNGNPYFTLGGVHISGGNAGKWLLYVGILHPHTYSGGSTELSGVYNPITGERIAGGTDFKMASGTDAIFMRCYQYYAGSSSNEILDFAHPRIEAIDGTEVVFADLLRPAAAASIISRFDQVTSTQASSLQTLSTTVSNNSSVITQLSNTKADSASVTTQISTASGNATASAIASANTYTDTKTGALQSEYVLKVGADGKVAGFGLLANGLTGTQMAFSADKFTFVNPTGTDQNLGLGLQIKDNTLFFNKAIAREIIVEDIMFKRGIGVDLSVIENLQLPIGKITEANIAPGFLNRIVLRDPNAQTTGGNELVVTALPFTGGAGPTANLITNAINGGGDLTRITVNVSLHHFDTHIALHPNAYAVPQIRFRIRRGSTNMVIPTDVLNAVNANDQGYTLTTDGSGIYTMKGASNVNGGEPVGGGNTNKIWDRTVHLRMQFAFDAGYYYGSSGFVLEVVSSIGDVGTADLSMNVFESTSSSDGLIVSTDWSNIQNKPTTLAGYGITNALSTAGGHVSGPITSGEMMFSSYGGLHIASQNISGGWARGLIVDAAGGSRLAGAGFLGSNNYVESFHIDFKSGWWHGDGAGSQFELNRAALTLRSSKFILSSGHDISWGGIWANGFPTISAVGGQLVLYPNGSGSSGYSFRASVLTFPSAWDAKLSYVNGVLGVLTDADSAKGVAVGSLLVSNSYGDQNQVSANGAYIKGFTKIGHGAIVAREGINSALPVWQDGGYTLQLYTSDATHPTLTFHRGGYTAVGLIHDGEGLKLSSGPFRADGFRTYGSPSSLTHGRSNVDALSIVSAYGYLDIGAMNGSYAHFVTDRPNFWFNRNIQVVDGIGVYNTPWFFGPSGQANIGTLYARHVEGAETNGASGGNLYLNYMSNRDVYVGHGGGGARLMATHPDNHVMAKWLSATDQRSRGLAAPSAYSNGISLEFLDGGTAGHSGETYIGSLVFRPYSSGADFSGGGMHKLHFATSGRLYHQTGGANGWGSYEEIAKFEPSSYFNARSWINIPDNHGIFYNNGTHFYSYGAGRAMLYGGGSDIALSFGLSGVSKGYVYADNTNSIGFLDQNGSWAFRVNKDSNITEVYTNNLYVQGNTVAHDGNMSERSYVQRDLDLSGAQSDFVWVRIPFSGFNAGGHNLELSITRSIIDNGGSPYGGCTLKMSAQASEWHSGQRMATIQYGEHGSGSADSVSGGVPYFIRKAAVVDAAGGGYYLAFQMRGGMRYSIRRFAHGNKNLDINGAFEGAAPPWSADIRYGFNLIDAHGTARFYKNGHKILDWSDFTATMLPPAGLENVITANWLAAGVVTANIVASKGLNLDTETYSMRMLTTDQPILLKKNGVTTFAVNPDGSGFFGGGLADNTVTLNAITTEARRGINPYYLGYGENVSLPSGTFITSGTAATFATMNSLKAGDRVVIAVRASDSWNWNGIGGRPSYSNSSYSLQVQRSIDDGAWVNVTNGAQNLTVVGFSRAGKGYPEPEPPQAGYYYESSFNVTDQVPTTSSNIKYRVVVTCTSAGIGTSSGLTFVKMVAEKSAFVKNIASSASNVTRWTDKETGYTIITGRAVVAGDSSVTVAYGFNLISVVSEFAQVDFSGYGDWSGGAAAASDTAITVYNQLGVSRTVKWVVYGFVAV